MDAAIISGSMPSRTRDFKRIKNQLFDLLRMALACAFETRRKDELAQFRLHADACQVLAQTRIKQRLPERGGGCADQDVTENPQAEIEHGVGCIGQFPVDRPDNASSRCPYLTGIVGSIPLFWVA